MQGRLWMREKSDKPAKLTTIAILVECATTTSLPFLKRLSVQITSKTANENDQKSDQKKFCSDVNGYLKYSLCRFGPWGSQSHMSSGLSGQLTLVMMSGSPCSSPPFSVNPQGAPPLNWTWMWWKDTSCSTVSILSFRPDVSEFICPTLPIFRSVGWSACSGLLLTSNAGSGSSASPSPL